MGFTPIAQSDQQRVIDLVNGFLNRFNQYAIDDTTRLKLFWRDFWRADRSQSDMQAMLDLMATTPATDPQLGSTNALAAMFARALWEITDVTNVHPSGLDDARVEATAIVAQDGTITGQAALQPAAPGQSTRLPYSEFRTPGWYYTYDQTGRMVISTPVNWGGTPSQQQTRYATCQSLVAAANSAASSADAAVTAIQAFSSHSDVTDMINESVAQAAVAHTAATNAAASMALVDVNGTQNYCDRAQVAAQICASNLTQAQAMYPNG